MLSGSGHIAGVVNPPDKVKYQYWTSGKRAKTLEQWLASAKEHPGSWWPHWAEWLAEHSGELDRAARAGRESRRHRGRPRLLRQSEVVGSDVDIA